MTIVKKKQKLRNNEYYNTQPIFYNLYYKSKNKNNYRFFKLMGLISNRENILLAHRNIRKHPGSKTNGADNKNIEYLNKMKDEEIVSLVRNRLNNFYPQEVRRVEIPKPNGKLRPLGIPTIEDRLIQQCIVQVLEPICEAKFHKHSYGFRPNRSQHHAIGRCYHLIQRNNLHYVVDMDIKSFFDNVSHTKLMKQIWNLGIQDKQLLCIIGKMLKSPIKGIGVPTKGTPQGGILSPLLSNIVLNELDWWLSDQWETYQTNKDMTTYQKDGRPNYGNKYKALRNTGMKELFIVRYADDLKIFCRNYNCAKRIYHGTKQWLEERLNLEISTEKSKIINLNKNYSEFLGFKIKLQEKKGKYRIKSNINDKAKERIINNIRKQIKIIAKDPNQVKVNQYNAIILSVHQYYKVASHVNIDFHKIGYKVSRCLYNQLKSKSSSNGLKSENYEKYYGKYNFKKMFICKIALFPIQGVVTNAPMNFSQDICDYTELGRVKIHNRQRSVSSHTLRYIMENPIKGESVEYNDNRISLYVGQNGKCAIRGTPLILGEMACHHKIPRANGGTDEYKNLTLIDSNIHKLIHSTKVETIQKYSKILNLKETEIKKINEYRKKIGNTII